MEETILSKYGGSSLTNSGAVEHIAKITSADPRRTYIVVSAPGDSDKKNKVTSRLIHLASLRGNEAKSPEAQEDIDFIVAKYETLYPGKGGFVGDEISKSVHDTSLDLQWYAASLRALGEELQAKLLAQALGYQFVDFKQFMILSEDADDAKVLPQTSELIAALDRQGQKLVFPGYGGMTKSGKIATLSRDGTNLSASVIAAARKVHIYENFSDSPVLAADPKIVSDAKVISEMTYKEMRDLSYSGFSIFHREAILPLQGTGIPIHLRATHDFPKDGTMVVEDRVSDQNHPVVGVAYKNGFAAFSVEKMGLNDVIGGVYHLLGVFYKRDISIEFPATGVDDISIIVEQEKVRKNVSEIKAELYAAAGANGTQVEFTDNLGCIAVAGKGLARDRKISAQIETTLYEAGINPVADSKGVQKRCFMYAVEEQHGYDAVRALYDRFIR